MSDFKLIHFEPQEFVPYLIYQNMGDSSLLLMKTIILITAEDIRSYFGKPVYINTLYTGGRFDYRGFRPAYCTVGAETGEHRLGGAIDCDIDGVSPEEARQAILKNPDRFPYITRIEDAVNWLHVDCKKTGLNKITLFKA